MQRFFCDTCQRVKRVRKLPYNIQGSEGGYVGECAWHSYDGGKSHAAFMGRDGIPTNPPVRPNPKPAIHFPSKPTRKSRVIDYSAT